jgi:PAS domain S-box-containing protein
MNPVTRQAAALPAEVLAAIARATGQLLAPEALYDVLYEQTSRLVKCDAFYLALWDSAREAIHFVAHTDRGKRLPPQVRPVGEGPTSWVVRNAKTYLSTGVDDPVQLRGARFGSGEPSGSAVHVPLILGDRLVGVLSAQSYEGGAYSPASIQLLEALATHAAIAVEAARIARTTREAEAVAQATLAGTRALRELAHDLPGIGTLDAVIERGLHTAMVVMEADGAMIAGRFGEQTPGLVVLGSVGREARVFRAGDILLEQSLQGAVARTGRRRISPDLEAEPEVSLDPRRPHPHRPGAVVPMRFGEIAIGVLTVSGPDGQWAPSSEDAVLLLEAVADQVAAAVSGLRLRGELLTRLDQIDALGRVAHALTGVEDAFHTMQFLAEEGMRVFSAQRAGVFLLDRASGGVECLCPIGLSHDYLRAVERHFMALKTTRTLLEGHPVFLETARGDLGSPIAAAVRAEGYASAALLPLVFAGETIGALCFYHDRAREHTPDERRLAVAFADQAALAIGKSRLLDLVTRIKREWQTAFDATGSGLAILDAEGQIVRANRFVADLAGLPVTGIPGTSFRAALGSTSGEAQDPLAVARRTGAPVTELLELDSGRALVLTATPLPEGGHVVALDDVSDLIRLENRFRMIVQSAHDAIILAGPDGIVRFANAAAAELFGLSEADLWGRALAGLVPGDPGAGSVGSRRFESRLLRPDGQLRDLAVSLASLGTASSPAGSVVLIRDVTPEREAVEKLRRSEARYRALFAAAPVAIFTLGTDGAFQSVNPAARDLAGLGEGTGGEALAGFLMPAERDFVEAQFAAAGAGMPREFQMHFRRPDGSVREAVVVAVPAAEGRESPAQVLALARDVTDEQRLREQLGHSEKMGALGQLVSGVAHELNNPLAGITALAQALILEEPLDEGTRRVLETIRLEATRSARIVSDLLTFARQRPLHRADMDLNAVVQGALKVAAEQDGLWSFHPAEGLPLVSADADQVRQVIVNLVTNAEHAMRDAPAPAGVVRTWFTDSLIGCEVCDTGSGIAPATMARIFEPFFTTKAVGEGTGLGLSISHGIIRAHGGDIRAENRPGGGARFWFELPRHPGRASR